MRRLLSMAVLSVAATGFMLAMPTASRAEGCGYGGNRNFYGPAAFPGSGAYVGRGYTNNYTGAYGSPYQPSFSGYHNRRPVVEHPTSVHWTPYRGLHTHGHIHVPHRGHSHRERF